MKHNRIFQISNFSRYFFGLFSVGDFFWDFLVHSIKMSLLNDELWICDEKRNELLVCFELKRAFLREKKSQKVPVEDPRNPR
jgi:hypothetical protein